MCLFILIAMQIANLSWSPPAQAEWAHDIDSQASVKLLPDGEPVAIDGRASLTVQVFAKRYLAISPMINYTRGIAFRVTTLSGKPVRPAVLPAGSPPGPPLNSKDLVPVTTVSPLAVRIQEPSRTIFPKPGSYKVSATVNLIDTRSTPAKSIALTSAPIIVKVIK